MTQEEKQLLLKDLCARLLYGVKVWYPNGTGAISTVKGIVGDVCYFNEDPKYGNFCRIETVKPYLRPMSSMTEEEYQDLCNSCTWLWFKDDIRTVTHGDYKCYDWLNAHHFDYRGLIPMGLALKAPEGMYKTE